MPLWGLPEGLAATKYPAWSPCVAPGTRTELCALAQGLDAEGPRLCLHPSLRGLRACPVGTSPLCAESATPPAQDPGLHAGLPEGAAWGQDPVLVLEPYLAGRILAATWVGAGLPSHWQHWARPDCPTGWHLAVPALGFCCPVAQPV